MTNTELIWSILFSYGMGAFVVGFGSSMWYDLSRLHAYPKKEKIMDLTLAEWTVLSALFWPLFLLTAACAFVYTYGSVVLTGPVKVVKKVNNAAVTTIEKRIAA